MHRVAEGILRYKKWLLIFFIIVILFTLLLSFQVKVNFNLASYVPDHAPSTKALRLMEKEYEEAIPNVRVYVPEISISQALAIKEELLKIKDVDKVLWLDDFIDLKQPLDIQDPELVKGFYHQGGALFQLVVSIDDTTGTLASLQSIAGEHGAVEGQLVDLALAKSAVSREMTIIMLIMVPLAVFLMMVGTHSWLEPLLLLAAIGVAVVINMGTNIFFKEVSFITQAVSGVLQMAVSMDYAIFLLHARQEFREAGMSRYESMKMAIVKSSNAIVASASTTILGFLSLIFMRFKIGPDLGIVLAKGILFSLVSVIFFLPVLIMYLDPLIDKSLHRPFMPKFRRLSKQISKHAVLSLIFCILIVPAYLAQSRINFTYGSSDYHIGSRESVDRQRIQELFGKNLSMALLVPRGDIGREHQLESELDQKKEILGIMSYNRQVSRLIPSEVLPEAELKDLLSENYSRIILTVRTEKEGTHAFRLAEEIREIAHKHYGDDYYLVGESVVTLDMRDTIQKDNRIVNGLAIFSVGLVLLLSFRSLSIPLILLLTIETSIWINLSFPYFSLTPMNYIGYLVISTVQLGATVDYGILFSQNYLKNRSHLLKREAIEKTCRETIPTLIIPALILTIAGLILNRVSTIAVVSELGTVLGRGAFTSFLMVIFFLPGLLALFDPIIEKTTWKCKMKRS